ncbi:MAG TPA: protein-disulfide reductase DsbD domain-containing protein [Rhizomicrobium sp.]|nr:protein-disulfide reductase DsbD domain-containing protein [Rhizomicrobium sp.]
MRVFLAFLAFVFVGPAFAQIDSAPKVHARLIPEHAVVAPGSTVTVALEEKIRPGWHTYWVNPGEAGAPTEIQWSLPAGWRADAIQWPYPKRLPVGPLMDYGYENTVWLLADVHVPANAPAGDVVLKAAVSWLVCSEVCIPEDASVSIPLSVAAEASPTNSIIEAQFATARAKLPQSSPWPTHYRAGKSLDLFVENDALAKAHPVSADFFPLTQDTINDEAAQKLGFASRGLAMRLAPGRKIASAKHLDGVLVLTSSDGSVKALSIHASLGAVPEVDFANENNLGIALALLFAFIGGLILNLMPCVLPVLAMKAFAIASTSGAHPKDAAREGFAYGIGAVASFVALGATVVILRAGGEAIGWGFQLQEPVVVAFFALLMLAVGLNLSGLYEIPGLSAGDALTRRGGAVGAFFTGVLAVAVAAPCTAPFMATAIGYAVTQSTPIAMLIFAALGLGFAAPFIAIGISPRMLKILPRPGAWMLTFKRILAIPMYGAAIWLLWVLAQEIGQPAQTQMAGMSGESYTAARLDSLRATKTPVFVDATAAWCITCLVNEKVALSDSSVRDAFAKNHIVFLVADWTNRNAAITSLLEAHSRDGVPLYLYYAPGASDAKILPQVLTPNEVLNAIKN